jgi:hypothetical protein
MHHTRKFTKFALDIPGIEGCTENDHENPEENQNAWSSFINVLRQLILSKLSEIEEQVVPLLRGTKLRIENYFDVNLIEEGTKQ